jgi:osmotically-inducible protein OsmY
MRAKSNWLTTGGAILALLVAVGCERDDRRDQRTDRAGDGVLTAPAGEERTDTGITTQVQSRFYAEGDIRGRDITVRTNDGVVTLTGTVENEETRRKAVNVAQAVEGVTRVDDRLRVDAQAADRARDDRTRTTTGQQAQEQRREEDHEINAGWVTTQINARYFANREVSPWSVDVTTTSDGVVTLSGTVGSEEARQEAVRIARETDGVRRVDDRLRIERDDQRGVATTGADRPDAERRDDRQRDSDQPIADAWITTKIQSRYYLDQDIRGRSIDVQTTDGVVTLSGEVRSEAEKRQAVALARNTDGVRDVRETLRVAGVADEPRATTGAERRDDARPGPGDQARRAGEAVDDGWITTKIQSQYFLEQQVRGRDLNVETNNGVVTLRGQVESEEARRLAETIARETDGVRRVVNELTVAQQANR